MIIEAPSMTVVRRTDSDYGPGLFQLASEMRVRWAALNIVVNVPVGFRTNFASIPRGFRNLLPINGAHRLAAVFHDYLYSQSGELSDVSMFIDVRGDYKTTNKPQTVFYTRAQADRVFYDLMRNEGVGFIKARTMYLGVRMFGGVWQWFGSGGWKRSEFR